MMDPISFDDVRKAKSDVKPDARAAVAISRDGLKITIINVGDLKDGWVRIEADATDQGSRKAGRRTDARRLTASSSS